MEFNSDSEMSVSNDISGSGSVTKLGSGWLTVSGDNQYAGTTTIYAGTFEATRYQSLPGYGTYHQIVLYSTLYADQTGWSESQFDALSTNVLQEPGSNQPVWYQP